MESHMSKVNRAIIFTFLIVFMTGCGMARGVYELRPPASNIQKSNKTENEIQVFTLDNQPTKPVVYLANVAAHGNGYADNNVLLATLKKEASKVGAELVIITNKEISKDEIISSYGGGIMMSNQISRPHLYGIAGVYSKVKIGIHAGNDGIIKYISSNSPAEKSGLKEGMRLLSINGKYFNNTNLFQTEISNKSPGDIVTIEYLDSENSKKKIDVILESNN